MKNISFLVAAVGKRVGILIQIYALDEARACRAAEATLMDLHDENEPTSKCLGTDATPGIFLEGDAAYIAKAARF